MLYSRPGTIRTRPSKETKVFCFFFSKKKALPYASLSRQIYLRKEQKQTGGMMLLERAEILVKDGLEDEFSATMRDRALPLLANVPGVISVAFGRGVENPDKFMLTVAWAAMAAHTAFTKAPDFPAFRQMLMPFSKGGAMEHFDMSETVAGSLPTFG